MSKMKVIFCGTPQIAASILVSLLAMSDVEVQLVISQPDKPVGRKKELYPTCVKQVALEHNLPIAQPVKIADLYNRIEQLRPDFIVTCAYGQFIPTNILGLPTIDAINIHGSLLPKYRGGAPIQYAIKNGESETGISIMRMVKKMDAGGVYLQQAIPIEDVDDAGSIFVKLAKLAQTMLQSNLAKIYHHQLVLIPQDESMVTFSKNITSEEEQINWSNSAKEIWNHVRSLAPKPIAHTFINQMRYKIAQVEVTLNISTKPPGTIVGINKQGVQVASKDFDINILLIQRPGKKLQPANLYVKLNLKDLKIGDCFE